MPWDINGKTVLVTGGNSGIGLATAIALAEAGANVTITARTVAKAANAADKIEKATEQRPTTGIVDLADLSSVRDFASAFIADHERLDVLINNAGAIFGSRRETVDGFEMTFGTNHLGPFLLTDLLTPLLVASAPSRVINVASSGHTFAEDGIDFDDLQWDRRQFDQRKAYGQSKLANILHARELNQRLKDDGVTAYSVHPGVVRTSLGAGGDSWLVGIGMKLIGWRLRSPHEGAATTVWAATDPAIVEMAGEYFADCAPSKSTRHAKDDAQAEALWDISTQLVASA